MKIKMSFTLTNFKFLFVTLISIYICCVYSQDDFPLLMPSPIFSNFNEGYNKPGPGLLQSSFFMRPPLASGINNVDHKLLPDKLSSYSSICGVRGGYYFNRIIGGTGASEGEFPWQVSIQVKTGYSLRHVCGGAVIAPQWVITAGHCVSEVRTSSISIVAGDHNLYVLEGNEQRRGVINTYTTNFVLATFTNDIALLKVDSPFQFNNGSRASPICLPNNFEKFKGLATVSGWGRLSETGGSPQTLQQVTLPFVDNYVCKATYHQVGFSQYLSQCQLCAGTPYGAKDACQGDSGGPLICAKDDGRYYLCGIVSWGIGCARSQFPGIYTEVACYVDWIKNIVEQN